MRIDQSRIVERFLRYVQIETTSDETGGDSPSSEKEWDLARLLLEELRAMGLEAELDDHCYLYATIPAVGTGEGEPVIGFIAHMDTSPDASGAGVLPRIVRYEGGAIPLGTSGLALKPETFPELTRYIGQELIVTDGTTLLGADDKAGIAAIMEMAAYLTDHPELTHGEIRIAFTPDEEIGRGTAHFDLDRFGADYAYTVDGGKPGELQYECFNAASALVTCRGTSVHPGEAKGKMVNAIRLAGEYDAALPDRRPETTEGREGFCHLHRISGNVEEAQMHYLLRDFDREAFEEQKDTLRRVARMINRRYDSERITVEIKDQYPNMLDSLLHRMEIVDRAAEAMLRLGITPITTPIRGGTDGALLSVRGLPCPNLFAGGMNFHGPYEYLPIPSLVMAGETLLEIVVPQ